MKVDIEAIQTTIDFLQRLPQGAFNLSYEYNGDFIRALSDPFYEKQPEEFTCGAAGCVAGWLPIILKRKDIKYEKAGLFSIDGKDMNFRDLISLLLNVNRDIAEYIGSPTRYSYYERSPASTGYHVKLSSVINHLENVRDYALVNNGESPITF